MSRLPKYFLDDVKEKCNGQYFADENFVVKLLKHIDAVELELKISKEDEEEAVRRYGELELKMPKKVVLPKEVARIIEKKRSEHATDFAILVFFNRGCTKDFHLHSWLSVHSNRQNIIRALVNGYVIEETKEDRLQAGIKDLVNKWFHKGVSHADAAQEIADYVMTFNKEEGGFK